jgi:hypothetical protein
MTGPFHGSGSLADCSMLPDLDARGHDLIMEMDDLARHLSALPPTRIADVSQVTSDRSLIPPLPSPVPSSMDISRLSPVLFKHGQPARSSSTNVHCSGQDVGSIIFPLQMAHEFIQRLQESAFQHFLRQKVGWFPGWSLNGADTARLLLDITDARFWAHEHLARSFRQPSARCSYFEPHSNPQSEPSELQSWSDPQQPIEQQPGRILGHTTTVSKDTFRVSSLGCGLSLLAVSQIRQTHSERDHPEPDTIEVFAVPETTIPNATAVQMIFSRSSDYLPPSVALYTYNMIPERSDVIKYVLAGDTVNFRRLIDNGLASPRDIDPDGRSLLFVSRQSGSKNR